MGPRPHVFVCLVHCLVDAVSAEVVGLDPVGGREVAQHKHATPGTCRGSGDAADFNVLLLQLVLEDVRAAGHEVPLQTTA